MRKTRLLCWRYDVQKQDAAAVRASTEEAVRVELKRLKSLRKAGVASWKEVIFGCLVYVVLRCLVFIRRSDMSMLVTIGADGDTPVQGKA